MGTPKADNDAPTKAYVDSRKPLITIWAEEKDALHNNAFLNGADGEVHVNCGNTKLANGRLIRMGLSTDSKSGEAIVNLVVNCTEQPWHGVRKRNGEDSISVYFINPLQVKQGDWINFRTAARNRSVSSAILNLLIELNM